MYTTCNASTGDVKLEHDMECMLQRKAWGPIDGRPAYGAATACVRAVCVPIDKLNWVKVMNCSIRSRQAGRHACTHTKARESMQQLQLTAVQIDAPRTRAHPTYV